MICKDFSEYDMQGCFRNQGSSLLTEFVKGFKFVRDQGSS